MTNPVRDFAYRLALALGIWDVDGLLEAMPARQMMDWMLYAAANPWGEERADLRAGIIAAATVNCWSKGRTWQPKDFMPLLKKSNRGRARQTPEQMRAVLGAFSQAQNAAVALERMHRGQA